MTRFDGRTSSPSAEAELLEAPSIVAVEQASEMVDFAGVVGIVGDHRCDDPAGRALLAPVRQAWPVELAIVRECRNMVDEPAVGPGEPSDDLVRRAAVGERLDLRCAELEGPSSEGVVVVHDLARA